MSHVYLSSRALWCALVSLTLAACSEVGPSTSRPLSLSITTARSGAALPAGSAVSAAIQIGSGANSLTITQAQVTLERIELAATGTCADDTEESTEQAEPSDPMTAEHDADAEDDCAELRIAPTLVTLPVDGTTKLVLEAMVPAGTYSGVEAKLDSVKVTGVYTDAGNQTHPFTFATDIDAQLQATFQPPITVAAGTSNFTVDVDVASWFKDATGAALDPTNAANAATIAANIRRSVRAFEDDNHDGQDDHEEAGTGEH